MDTKEGTVVVPWMAICKVLHIGDFIEVTGGLHKEQKGWVDEVDLRTQVANIIRMVDEETSFSDNVEVRPILNENPPCSYSLQTFQVNIILLKHSDVPTLLGQHPKHAGAISSSEQVPWINLEIIITHGHPMKGYPGVIKDVLCNQRTPSGLQVVVQITSLDSTAPFKHITLDYDHVVEARYLYFAPHELPLTPTNSRGIKLHHFACPTAELFMPRTYEPPKSSPMVIPRPSLVISGNTTPFPESCLSSSPAWDPSSHTPQPGRTSPISESPSQSVDPEHAPNSCTSLISPSRPIPEHALLDPRLVNVGIKVVVNGGTYNAKELRAFIMSAEGRLCICCQKYKTLECLPLEWVTPKYPNAKRENGLLVVIKGEHFGKYARRIYHRFVVGDQKEAITILAVVNRVEGQVDTLTGDQLEMDASHLCVCDESIEDRKRNDLLMESLREEARKKRAK